MRHPPYTPPRISRKRLDWTALWLAMIFLGCVILIGLMWTSVP